ncbi:MAG: hypothetical protein CMJ18_04845 [Phycisphaeraceae bacterium]|nr:hypothetical protein [Phycisphaeraceae bacterium]
MKRSGASPWLATLALLAAAATAHAIQPAHWVHTTEADFASGEFEHVVVTNLGDLKLAAGTTVLGALPEPASIVYDLVVMGNDVLIAAGPEAKLLVRDSDGEKVDELLALENEQIFALDVYGDALLVGVSGNPSRLALYTRDNEEEGDGKALETLIELPGVRYVWDMLVVDGVIYVASGTDGQLLRVDPKAEAGEAGEADGAENADDPRIQVLLDANQANLLCLGRDGKGRIYAGSDTEGLIYRIVENDGEPEVFVLYDAAEPEVGALLVQEDGTVYAGMADANQARPGRLAAAKKTETGRPEIKKEKPRVPDQPKAKPSDDAAAPAEGDEKNPASDGPPLEPTEPANAEGGASKPQTMPAGSPNPATPDDAAGGQGDAEAKRKPTTEQFQQLREIISNRLMKARVTGRMQSRPGSMPARRPSAPSPKGTRSAKRGGARKPGNAIYCISPDAFVKEIFRESVMILRIIEHREKLLVATGNEGQIYQVDPDAEETTILTELEPRQVPAMQISGDHVLIGTANPATLVRLDRGFSREGTFTSDVLDASQVSKWGKLLQTCEISDGTSIGLQTRSGNVADPEQAAWSEWSPQKLLKHDPDARPLVPIELEIQAPTARFLQYRLTMLGDGSKTPSVDRIAIAYVVPNLKPQIASLQIKAPGGAAGSATPPRPRAGAAKPGAAEPRHQSKLNIVWKASDPNKDRLIYALHYSPAGVDRKLLIAEDLSTATHTWMTQRVPDGWYVLYLTASDRLDNISEDAATATRRSDPVLVDNAPPRLEKYQSELPEKGTVSLTFEAVDELSAIRGVHWSIDAADDWKPVLPDDRIFDSTAERLTVRITDLDPGPHVLTLRLTDAVNNARYEAKIVEIE